MRYIIPGPPISWARPGSNGKLRYDTQSGEKMVVATNLKFLHKDKPLFKGPLSLEICFYIKHTKKRGYHDCRPDIDNLVKFYMDAMNGILYEDDSQVTQIIAYKIYAMTPSTEITIVELNFGKK